MKRTLITYNFVLFDVLFIFLMKKLYPFVCTSFMHDSFMACVSNNVTFTFCGYHTQWLLVAQEIGKLWKKTCYSFWIPPTFGR
jgi:hypothetical protein